MDEWMDMTKWRKKESNGQIHHFKEQILNNKLKIDPTSLR